ncbi:MAG: hypothetical protein ACRC67_05230 [Inquilinus sp.]|uniref:hypothetical protein n=1 Tax=Inquilinus sp. TaxID=1932117 RepID=UPI003F31A25D
MKVAVQDTATLRALKPLEMATYLRAKGWRQEADLAGKGSLWLVQAADGTEFDVTLPARRELGDYALRMAELLQVLAGAEGRSQLEILRDVQTTSADLIRVRAPSRDAEGGTLPFDQAVTFVERSRDMMLAAACAAIDKRAVYAKRKAQQAMDYLGHVRMGQTERGSYVLTILSPVTPELRPAQESLLPVESVDPYERKVTRTLMEALHALDEAARDAAVQGNMTPFQAAVTRGVSANLCDAVVGLSAVSPGEGLDIQVAWSRTRPIEGATPARVLLDSDCIPLIEEASRQFRDTAPIDDVEIVGFVKTLDRGPTATEGDISIIGPVDGQIRRVSVRLGPDQYSEASRAHDDRRTVRCTGELIKEGRGYRLLNPRHFEVLLGDEVG